MPFHQFLEKCLQRTLFTFAILEIVGAIAMIVYGYICHEYPNEHLTPHRYEFNWNLYGSVIMYFSGLAIIDSLITIFTSIQRRTSFLINSYLMSIIFTVLAAVGFAFSMDFVLFGIAIAFFLRLILTVYMHFELGCLTLSSNTYEPI
ncbi:hypothetical protein CHUAL_007657 [Chamberlinius hualienensis]